MDTQQIVVAGPALIAVAPVGTTLPTDESAALDSGFTELGYTSDEGVGFTFEQTIEDVLAQQTADPVRRIVTARSLSTNYQGLQWNKDTFALAFGGGTWTEPTPGTFRYDPPGDEDALSEYSQVISWNDGSRKFRLVIERGNVAEATETTLARTSASVLPVTFQAMKPTSGNNESWYFLGDDTAFDGSGSGSGSGSGL